MSEVTNKAPVDPNAWKKELEGKSEKVKKAITNHHNKYNCAQSVACAFAEDLGMDEETVFRIMEGFGFGMGAMETCGAVSGMTAIVGLKESDGNLEKPGTKKKSYRVSKELIRRFREKNGSVICRELKGVETKKMLRSCNGCIEDAVELVAAYLRGDLDRDLEAIEAREKAKAAAKAAIAKAAEKSGK